VSESEYTKTLVLTPHNLHEVAQELRSIAKEAISSIDDIDKWSDEDINKLYLAAIYLELHLLERFLILGLPEEDARRQCMDITQFLLNLVYKEMFKVDIVPPNVIEYFSTYFSSNYKIISQELILAPIPYKGKDEDFPILLSNFCKCIEEIGLAPYNVVKIIAQNIWNNWPQITLE